MDLLGQKFGGLFGSFFAYLKSIFAPLLTNSANSEMFLE